MANKKRQFSVYTQVLSKEERANLDAMGIEYRADQNAIHIQETLDRARQVLTWTSLSDRDRRWWQRHEAECAKLLASVQGAAWVQAQFPDLEVGDQVWIPDLEPGEQPWVQVRRKG